MRRRAFVAGLFTLGAAPLVAGCATPTPARVRQIGYLSANLAAPGAQPTFLRRLRQLGYVEGRDVLMTSEMSNVKEELDRMASQFVSRGVDVIVASGGPAHLAAARATSAIPIVVLRGPDPVVTGLAQSHARPGGNVTGVAWDTTGEGPKKLQLLKDAAPSIRRVAALYRSDNTSITSAEAAERAAASLGLEVGTFGAGGADEMDDVLEKVAAWHFDGILATSVLTVVRTSATVPEFAARHRLPQIFGDIEIVRAGGLMHYGVDFTAMDGEVAVFVDKIFKGADPAVTPISLAPVRDFVVNLSAAKRIGLVLPASILRQATETIL